MVPSIQFTERELQVIELLIQGRSNKQIALALGLSQRTVEFHLSKIYAKLAVTSRTEAVLKLSQERLRESTGADLRESTVPDVEEPGDNDRASIPPRRSLVSKSFLIGFSILVLTSAFCLWSLYDMANDRAEAQDAPPDAVATAAVFPENTQTHEANVPTVAPEQGISQPAEVTFPPHTVNGYTASIESYYIDASHILFQVRITGGETDFGDENFYSRFRNAEVYEGGTQINTSGGWGPAVDPSLIEFTFFPQTLLKGDRLQGEFAFDLLDAPHYDQPVAQFRFELDLPVYPDTRFSPRQTISANGLEMLLDSVTVSPTFTQAYLCFAPPSYAPWTIGSQTLLQIDAREASLQNFDLLFGSDLGGDRTAGREPYWTPPVKNGRCMKVGFPIGSSHPTSLTLSIPSLENLVPDLLMNDQLLTNYPGLSPKAAYQTYLKENGNTYRGPWVFTVDLRR